MIYIVITTLGLLLGAQYHVVRSIKKVKCSVVYSHMMLIVFIRSSETSHQLHQLIVVLAVQLMVATEANASFGGVGA